VARVCEIVGTGRVCGSLSISKGRHFRRPSFLVQAGELNPGGYQLEQWLAELSALSVPSKMAIPELELIPLP
jgi:hypothetical protein